MISINPKQSEGKKDMQYIASRLSDRNIEFLGPSECLISKIRNKFRFHLIIKTNNVKNSVYFLRNLVENKKFDSRIVIDVDAIDFF